MDIKIGQSFDANTPINEILGAIRINPVPEPMAVEPEPLVLPRHKLTVSAAQAGKLAKMTVSEGKRWAMGHFELEDEVAAYMVHSVGIALDRALKDLGLLKDYEMTFATDGETVTDYDITFSMD